MKSLIVIVSWPKTAYSLIAALSLKVSSFPPRLRSKGTRPGLRSGLGCNGEAHWPGLVMVGSVTGFPPASRQTGLKVGSVIPRLKPSFRALYRYCTPNLALWIPLE